MRGDSAFLGLTCWVEVTCEVPCDPILDEAFPTDVVDGLLT